jgi:glycine/D-amino acid oxidase-like deaminating enzyme
LLTASADPRGKTMHRQAVTPEKTLRAGKTVWAGSSGTHVGTIALTGSIKADVVVVGAGISGAFMAHALAPRYERVVALDRRGPMAGATTASTALLQFEIDEPLTKLSDKIGARNAARAWRRSFRATQDLVRMVGDESIRCGMERRNALYLAGTDMGARALEAESKARNRAKLPGDFVSAERLREEFGIDRTGAILSPLSAVANPVQLTSGLLRRGVARGAKIFAPVNVEGVTCSKHGVVLDTGKHFVEAKQVVFCTGYEVLKALPAQGAKITSSWAIASRPHAHYPRWLDHTLVWEASTPYLYLRTTPDRRIVAGGEDEDIDIAAYRARSIEAKSKRLTAKLEALIPGLSLKPSYKWTGAFGESKDGLPLMDAVPGMPGCFAVMGFGGNGTIYSMIAAQIVPTLMKGRPDPDASLYRFRG